MRKDDADSIAEWFAALTGISEVHESGHNADATVYSPGQNAQPVRTSNHFNKTGFPSKRTPHPHRPGAFTSARKNTAQVAQRPSAVVQRISCNGHPREAFAHRCFEVLRDLRTDGASRPQELAVSKVLVHRVCALVLNSYFGTSVTAIKTVGALPSQLPPLFLPDVALDSLKKGADQGGADRSGQNDEPPVDRQRRRSQRGVKSSSPMHVLEILVAEQCRIVVLG